MQRSDEARAQFAKDGNILFAALNDFRYWINRGDGDAIVWGNGADFDNVILANAYRALNQSVPWKFWNNRCYRTVKALHPEIKLERSGTHHNALDDAESQARHLIKILGAVENET